MKKELVRIQIQVHTFKREHQRWAQSLRKIIFMPNKIVNGYVHVDITHYTISFTHAKIVVETRFRMTICGASIFG